MVKMLEDQNENMIKYLSKNSEKQQSSLIYQYNSELKSYRGATQRETINGTNRGDGSIFIEPNKDQYQQQFKDYKNQIIEFFNYQEHLSKQFLN